MSAALLLVLVATGALGIVHAVRARRRMQARLGRLARACHELRGALSAMGLALSRMEEANGEDRWHRAVEGLRAQQARALVATEDLEAVRGDADEPHTETRTLVDVEVMVRRCVRAWAGAHGRWRVVLDWRAGRPAVWGQPGRLGQALDNLIANALEHGAGPVTIVGRLTGASVTVAVLDRGEGLRHSLHRPGPTSWRARRGHGLAIVRRAVDDHGGRMQIVREGRGTGVQISLPLADGSPAASAPGTAFPAAGPPGVARPA